MRIALFHNLLFGGAKRVAYEHARGLIKAGHMVDVYTTDTHADIFNFSKFTSEYRYPFELPQKTTPVISRFYKDYKNFISLQKLHRVIANDIDAKKYDVVLVHPDRYTQAPFLLRFLLTKNYYYCEEPLRIAYEYALRFNDKVSFPNKIYEVITRAYRKKVDLINTRAASHCIASCYHIRERMIESYDVYPSVNYPGIDTDVLKRKRVKKVNEVLFIGGKDVVTDGYDLIRDALKLLPKSKRPRLHVLSWVKQNNQRLTDSELAEVYSRSLLTVCVSRFETFGLVPLESMSCGTPVIATRVSGHRETVSDGSTGFLVEFSPKEIASKIELLIGNSSLRERIGNAGRKDIEKRWAWDNQIRKLSEILSSQNQ